MVMSSVVGYIESTLWYITSQSLTRVCAEKEGDVGVAREISGVVIFKAI